MVSLGLVGEVFEVRTQVDHDLTTVSRVDRQLRLIKNLGCHTEPVTVKLTSEMHSVKRCLHCLDEMRHICFYARLLSLYSWFRPASPISR
jgi:adenylate cyclase class IV